MKTIHKLLGLGFLTTLVALSCTKIDMPTPQVIDLGKLSTSTAIKSINQSGNVVTVGAKYSVQIVPFGSDEPVKKEGFTATETETKKIYDLSNLARKDYDLIFIDVSGKEVKYPIIKK